MTYWQTLKKFFSPLHEHPRDYFWNSVEAILISWYTIFSLEITRGIIIAIQWKNSETLYKLLMLFIVLSILLTIFRFVLYKEGWSPIMHNGIMRSIKVYMKKFIYAEGSIVEKIGTGKFLSTLDKWLHDWHDLLFELTFKGVAHISFILYAIYAIFRVSFFAGMISIWLFVLSGIIATLANFWMRDKRNLRRDAYKEALHNMTIMIMSRNEILQNNTLFDTFIAKVQYSLTQAREYHHIVALGFLVMEEFPRLMMLVIRIGLYIFIANMLWEWKWSFADFAIFITIIAMAEKALNEFLNLMRDALRLFWFIDLLWQTFDTLPPIQWYSNGETFHTHKWKDIELRDISFAYEKTPIFENFSLTIKKWKKTALVGASGWGKTTLMKLIAWYLHPDSGTVSVLGNDLRTTALKSYYPRIGYLTQEPSVFDGTIRDNLVSAIAGENTQTQTEDTMEKDSIVSERNKKNTTVSSVTVCVSQDEMLEKALRLAHCDFVFEMELGLDTEIGEKGVRLSWGQKQRLAIAKIFLKNPEIILLDEPTSALDSFSEEQITKALDELFRDRSVIVIAHRLQTVKKADDIIVIEGGKVIERGNHESLMKEQWVYNRMLELQSGF